uniref:Succinate dehydrogenase n=1 Tax=Thermofilum adornatum TaxID=1365176 RepID=A0A7C1GCN3_9CREN
MNIGYVLRSWFKLRGRSLEQVSFAARRLAGIIMALYFLAHVIDISTVVLGKDVYNAFVGVFTSPPAILVDLFLWAALVIHGVLGLYSLIVEMGIMVEKRKTLLAISWVTIVLLFLIGTWVIMNVF